MVVVFCEERNAWFFRVAWPPFFHPILSQEGLFTSRELILVVFSLFKLGGLRFYPVSRGAASELSHLESYTYQPASQSTSFSVNRQLGVPPQWLLTSSSE